MHDFRHHYGVDLPVVVRDLCSATPTRDPVEVLTLITELPDDSAFVASLQGGREYRGWGAGRHLEASRLDALHALIYVLRAVNGDKKTKPPEPFPRPGAKKRKPMGVRSLAQMAKTRPKGG